MDEAAHETQKHGEDLNKELVEKIVAVTYKKSIDWVQPGPPSPVKWRRRAWMLNTMERWPRGNESWTWPTTSTTAGSIGR